MASWSSDAGANSGYVSIDELKARYDLRELIGPHLEKARPVSGGDYLVGCCPFHDDKRPSFIVRKESYACLSAKCGEWGSVIDWFGHRNSGYSFGELLKLIANDAPQTAYLPARKPKVKRDVEPLPKPMDIAELGKFPTTRTVLDFCHEKWLLTEQTVKREGIGHDERRNAVVIPVWGESLLDLITLRFRGIRQKRYWGIDGRNDVYGYGRRWLKGCKHAVVVFGEMTALFVHQWGFASFSWTNGCSSFRPYLKGLLSHLQGGVVVPDVGEEEKGLAVAIALGDGWEVAFLDEIWDGEGDIIDWVQSEEGSLNRFCRFLQDNARMPQNGIRKYAAALYGEQEWIR